MELEDRLKYAKRAGWHCVRGQGHHMRHCGWHGCSFRGRTAAAMGKSYGTSGRFRVFHLTSKEEVKRVSEGNRRNLL